MLVGAKTAGGVRCWCGGVEMLAAWRARCVPRNFFFFLPGSRKTIFTCMFTVFAYMQEESAGFVEHIFKREKVRVRKPQLKHGFGRILTRTGGGPKGRIPAFSL